MIIVDTSAIIDFLRGKDSQASKKMKRIELDQTPYFIPTFCIQEILQGAKNEKEWDLLYSYLTTQQILGLRHQMESALAAARIYYECRRKGITVRSTIDCLIVQIVLENEGSSLLHNDRDFDSIRKVLSFSSL